MDAPQVQRAGKIALVVGLADKISARVGTALGIFTDYKGFLDWTIDSLSKAVLAMSPDTALILIGVGILLWGQFGDWVRARIGHVRPIRARLVAGSRETTPSPPDTVTLTPVGREPTALAPRLVETEAASVGLRRDIEMLGEETVACREVVKALRPWIAELARVQITVAKVAALHRLPADAPHPPEAGDRANAEAMEGFSQEVARYLSIVLATSRQWSLPDLDHCEAMMDAARRAAESELETSGTEARWDAATLGRLRRYRIARKQLDRILEYISIQRFKFENEQQAYISYMLKCYEENRPKLGPV